MKPIEKWLNQSLTKIEPMRIIATTEARCNLACEHCYWAHDMSSAPISDWRPAARKIANLGVPVFFAGRILTPNGAFFLKHCISEGIKEIGIVDNGYTILTEPNLLPHYTSINISIDGWREKHDQQRGKVGAFDKAWSTVMELKKQGYDPIISSALSPITLNEWERFENLLAENDVPVSSTLVWALPNTAKRGTAVFAEKEMCVAFEKLMGGIPKLINIYSFEHAQTLWPILSQLHWNLDTEFGDCLTATLSSGVTIVYRPASLVSVFELSLQWDGVFYTPFTYGKGVPEDEVDTSYLEWARKTNTTELELWSSILKGGD
ncbi:MAG: hypothetical protein AAB381_00705 [Patescibacteria group bacterium]